MPKPRRAIDAAGAAGQTLRRLVAPLGRLIAPAGRFIADRTQGARYFIADVFYAAARVPRALARGVAGFWRSLPQAVRIRLVAALGVIVAGIGVLALVVPNLPCEFPGGDECPPDDDAIELIPADALAYVHANIDPETEQGEQAAELVRRMPLVSRQVVGQLLPLLVGAAGLPSDFREDIEPWFGGEVAAAVVVGEGRTEQVQLLEVGDPDGARAYAESIAAGALRETTYEGVEIAQDERNLATALVGDFLVLGTARGVRAIVDVSAGAENSEPLSEDPLADSVLDELPEHRVVEAYFSRDGIADFVAAPASSLSALEPLIDSEASRGAALSLSASEDGIRLASRSVLDPERSEAEPGFFDAFEEFEPELPEELAPDTLAYLGLGGAQRTIEALLAQATVRAPGVALGLTDLVESLRRTAGVDIERDLLPAIAGEAAFAVVPRPRTEAPAEDGPEGLPGAGPPPETLAPGEANTPYLEFIASDVDEARARDALARLQGPIARAFDPELGAPVFEERRFGDLRAQIIRISPVAQLVYATFESKLVIANDPAAVARLASGDGGALADEERFDDALEGLPEQPLLVVYLDLGGLLEFAERSGLAEDTAYGAFAPDLRRLETFALGVRGSDEMLATDARLVIE